MLAARTPPQGHGPPASSRAEAAQRGARHPRAAPGPCRAPQTRLRPGPPGNTQVHRLPRIAHSFPCHEPRGNEHLRPLIFFLPQNHLLGKKTYLQLSPYSQLPTEGRQGRRAAGERDRPGGVGTG